MPHNLRARETDKRFPSYLRVISALCLCAGITTSAGYPARADFINLTTLVDDSVSFIGFVDDTANEPVGLIALGSGVNW